MHPSYRCVRPVHHTSSRAAQILRQLVASDAGTLRRLVVTALAALSGLAAYAIFTEAAQGTALDARVRALTSENATIQTQISERRQQIGEADNKDWLEEQARRLGFVYPGESVFIITAPNAALPAGGGINAALPTFAAPATAPAVPAATPAPSPSATPKPTPFTFVLPTPPSH